MSEVLDKVIVNKITKARYNELVATGVITPTMINEQVWLFTDDQFVSSAEKNIWNNKASLSDIPNRTSQLQNDSGYITGINSSDVTSALGYIPINPSEKGVANGIAELDNTGKVPSAQLPSYVDDVVEGYYNTINGKFYKESTYTIEILGESGKIYVDLNTNKTYRWGGSAFAEISESLALGTTSTTAFRGDYGEIAYQHAQSPHAPANAEANTIDSISVNGTGVSPDANKNVNIDIPTKVSDLDNDSGYITGMTILSYGHSTWNDFLTAYSANRVVYCRASSNSNPGTGAQNRLAFMAYLNNATSPTEVEFQYYRSVSSHSDSQQGDQMYVYKLTSSGTWTVTVRNSFSRVIAGTNLTSTYGNSAITLNAPSNVSAFTNDSGYLTSETDPVFSASAAAGITSNDITNWDAKQNELVSGTNIKTINNQSILGSGNIDIQGGSSTTIESNIATTSSTPFVLSGKSVGLYQFAANNTLDGIVYVKGRSTDTVSQWQAGAFRIYIYKEYDDAEDLEEFAIVESLSGGNSRIDRVTWRLRKEISSVSGLGSVTKYSYTIMPNIVQTNNAQTITAKKTFTVLPESSVVPTTDNQLVNKKYVDNINEILSTETTSGLTNITDTTEHTLITKTLNKGYYLFIGNIPVNYYAQTGREIHLKIYKNSVVDFTDVSVINTAAYTINRPIVYLLTISTDNTTVELRCSSSVADKRYDIGSSFVQFIKIRDL